MGDYLTSAQFAQIPNNMNDRYGFRTAPSQSQFILNPYFSNQLIGTCGLGMPNMRYYDTSLVGYPITMNYHNNVNSSNTDKQYSFSFSELVGFVNTCLMDEAMSKKHLTKTINSTGIQTEGLTPAKKSRKRKSETMQDGNITNKLTKDTVAHNNSASATRTLVSTESVNNGD